MFGRSTVWEAISGTWLWAEDPGGAAGLPQFRVTVVGVSWKAAPLPRQPQRMKKRPLGMRQFTGSGRSHDQAELLIWVMTRPSPPFRTRSGSRHIPDIASPYDSLATRSCQPIHKLKLSLARRDRAGHRCRWCHPQGAEGPQGSGCSPGSHRLKLSRS